MQKIQDEYSRLILELSGKSNGASEARVGAILSSTICEQLASHIMFDRKGSQEEIVRFDPYYNEKHEMAKRKFVDRLKTKLDETGRESQFQIRTERTTGFGRCDLEIINGNKLRIQKMNGRAVAVELKASLGLNLDQTERYLLCGETLLIVRIMTGHVIRLPPDELSEFLEESMKDLASKAHRIIQGRPFLVPGYECRKCPIKECAYSKRPEAQERKLLTMTQDEFERDLKTFMQNLYPTIDKAVQATLKELGIEL